MLKKEIFIVLLITVFSLGLTGVTLADDPGQNLSEAINTYVETDPMADAEITQLTSIELEHGNLNAQSTWRDLEPLVCDNDFVFSAELIASNDCRDLYSDIFRN
jgi:hypothetical protein